MAQAHFAAPSCDGEQLYRMYQQRLTLDRPVAWANLQPTQKAFWQRLAQDFRRTIPLG